MDNTQLYADQNDVTPLSEPASLPTQPRTQSPESSSESAVDATMNVVYVVTDTCYPTAADFNANKGNMRVDSAHSTVGGATRRAKKILYQSGPYKVDRDKIIEEVKGGIYTGIGTGGSEEEGGCYARKCGVEAKAIDEDSEDDEEEEEDDDEVEQDSHAQHRGRQEDVVMG